MYGTNRFCAVEREVCPTAQFVWPSEVTTAVVPFHLCTSSPQLIYASGWSRASAVDKFVEWQYNENQYGKQYYVN